MTVEDKTWAYRFLGWILMSFDRRTTINIRIRSISLAPIAGPAGLRVSVSERIRSKRVTRSDTEAPSLARTMRATRDLLVARHRRQLADVLQQDATALQIQNTVLAPQLQLAIDA